MGWSASCASTRASRASSSGVGSSPERARPCPRCCCEYARPCRAFVIAVCSRLSAREWWRAHSGHRSKSAQRSHSKRVPSMFLPQRSHENLSSGTGGSLTACFRNLCVGLCSVRWRSRLTQTSQTSTGRGWLTHS
eukprot:Amastigsp_a518407_5.p3 type:complete len:135 gc:universal Amastigsp_a518407_5:518-114(-)